MPFCTACGKQNPDDARFCSQCGTRLVGADTNAPPQPEASGETTATLDVSDRAVATSSGPLKKNCQTKRNLRILPTREAP